MRHDRQSILDRFAVFHGAPEGLRQEVLAASEEVSLPAGLHPFQEGSSCQGRMDRRVAAYLLSRRPAARQGAVLELTHGAIATELGSAREVVSRVLKELEREGAVALGRGRIELADLELLERLAEPTTGS